MQVENPTIVRNLEVEEKNGRYMAIVGHEDHGRPSYKIWCNRNIKPFEKEEYGIMGKYVALTGTKVVPTKSKSPKSKNLIPAKGWNTTMVSVPAGYRGESSFKIYRDERDENPIEVNYSRVDTFPWENIIETDEFSIVPFARFYSERGNLGIEVGAVISTTLPHFLIEWERSGRTYGAPECGVSVVYAEGKIFNYEDITIEDTEDITY
jgi:hypothetical protein